MPPAHTDALDDRKNMPVCWIELVNGRIVWDMDMKSVFVLCDKSK